MKKTLIPHASTTLGTAMHASHSFARLAAFALATAAGLTQAAPVVVNFENFPNTTVQAVVTSGGFAFTAAAGPIAIAANGSNCSPTCAANGTSALAVGSPNLNPPSVHPVTMLSTAGLFFRLIGLDFAELSESAATNFSASSIRLTGNLFGGGTITQDLQIDGINDGPGGVADFQSAVLAAGWATSDLTSLQFAGFIGGVANKAFQLDNIAVDVSTPVPTPATLSLVAAALLAAGAARRRADRRG